MVYRDIRIAKGRTGMPLKPVSIVFGYAGDRLCLTSGDLTLNTDKLVGPPKRVGVFQLGQYDYLGHGRVRSSTARQYRWDARDR